MRKNLVPTSQIDRDIDLINNFFEKNSLASSFFNDFYKDRPLSSSFFNDFFSNNDFTVDIDIIESRDSINIKAELPGIKKEDISVDLNDGVLTLKAEKKDVIKEKDETFLQRESKYGVIQRSFNVGDIEDAKASYSDGVLTISLKKKDSNFKKIEVQ